ncbi:hypothetical protein ADUPG1_012624 [Aduncisulcus paluster]|uniref:Uncharacterized protein n=1 Tax=Aduncisulcus paluster TaxID=2918883 RepID=A0ABQ5K033_9EUKA|nr:hypothetical protein ADUPG1_012624 [Aduncisulcus paluster]
MSSDTYKLQEIVVKCVKLVPDVKSWLVLSGDCADYQMRPLIIQYTVNKHEEIPLNYYLQIINSIRFKCGLEKVKSFEQCDPSEISAKLPSPFLSHDEMFASQYKARYILYNMIIAAQSNIIDVKYRKKLPVYNPAIAHRMRSKGLAALCYESVASLAKKNEKGVITPKSLSKAFLGAFVKFGGLFASTMAFTAAGWFIAWSRGKSKDECLAYSAIGFLVGIIVESFLIVLIDFKNSVNKQKQAKKEIAKVPKASSRPVKKED